MVVLIVPPITDLFLGCEFLAVFFVSKSPLEACFSHSDHRPPGRANNKEKHTQKHEGGKELEPKWLRKKVKNARKK